jgi:hypothetical protein
VFQYQQSSSGEWHGVISVPNPYPIVAIDIRVEIYITGTLPLVIQMYNFYILEFNTLIFKISLVQLINCTGYTASTFDCDSGE